TAAGEIAAMDEIPLWDGLEKPSFTVPWNLTGFPAIAVGMGFGDKGLPVSVQLGGRPFDEATLFQVAHLLETSTPWRGIRPQLCPVLPLQLAKDVIPVRVAVELVPALLAAMAVFLVDEDVAQEGLGSVIVERRRAVGGAAQQPVRR